MENLLNFWNNFKGAIIGVIISIILQDKKLYNVIITSVVLIIGAYIGNYR